MQGGDWGHQRLAHPMLGEGPVKRGWEGPGKGMWLSKQNPENCLKIWRCGSLINVYGRWNKINPTCAENGIFCGMKMIYPIDAFYLPSCEIHISMYVSFPEVTGTYTRGMGLLKQFGPFSNFSIFQEQGTYFHLLNITFTFGKCRCM